MSVFYLSYLCDGPGYMDLARPSGCIYTDNPKEQAMLTKLGEKGLKRFGYLEGEGGDRFPYSNFNNYCEKMIAQGKCQDSNKNT